MSRTVMKKCSNDEIIVNQGEKNRTLYKVTIGKVASYLNYGKPDELLIGVISAPACFGELSVLLGHPSPYTYVAMGDTAVLCVPEDKFESFVEANPRNAEQIMQNMSRHQSMLNLNMSMLADELMALVKSGRVDQKTVTRLVERYSS